MANKKKLFQFAEVTSFANVTEVGYEEALNKVHPLSGTWNEKVFKKYRKIRGKFY